MDVEARLRQLEQRVRRLVVVVAFLGGGLLVASAMALAPQRQWVGVAGGDTMLYQVFDDGSVKYLNTGSRVKTAKGIPTWAELAIDPELRPTR